jgi:hypothetical protein
LPLCAACVGFEARRPRLAARALGTLLIGLGPPPSAAVGVAISVTTIPAAAHAGVAAGLGEASDAVHGLAILGVNLVALQSAGTATLVVQRLRTPAGAPPPARRGDAQSEQFG